MENPNTILSKNVLVLQNFKDDNFCEPSFCDAVVLYAPSIRPSRMQPVPSLWGGQGACPLNGCLCPPQLRLTEKNCFSRAAKTAISAKSFTS